MKHWHWSIKRGRPFSHSHSGGNRHHTHSDKALINYGKTKQVVVKAEKKLNLNVYQGKYFVAAKDKGKAENLADKVSEEEPKVVLLKPQKQTTLKMARLAVGRDRRPLVTTKRPRVR